MVGKSSLLDPSYPVLWLHKTIFLRRTPKFYKSFVTGQVNLEWFWRLNSDIYYKKNAWIYKFTPETNKCNF